MDFLRAVAEVGTGAEVTRDAWPEESFMCAQWGDGLGHADRYPHRDSQGGSYRLQKFEERVERREVEDWEPTPDDTSAMDWRVL